MSRVIDVDKLREDVKKHSMTWYVGRIDGKSEEVIAVEDLELILNETPTVDAIIIPKDATNGDLMRLIFSDYYFVETDFGVIISGLNICQEINNGWWNTPYKESED